MDKRSVIALVLIFIVIIGGGILRPKTPPVATDTTTVPTRVDSAPRAPAATTPATRDTVSSRPAIGPATSTQAVTVARAETTTVGAKGRELRFVSPGASLSGVTLTDYPDLKRRNGPIALAPTNGPLLRYRIVNGADTIHLDRLAFTRTQSAQGVEFVSANPAVRIAYDADSVNYLTHATVTMAGAAPGAKLLIDLATDLASGEADEPEDLRNLAYGYRPANTEVQSVNLSNL